MNKITLGSFMATNRAKQLVMEVMDSGRLSYGAKSAEYERRFALMHECEHGVVSNSGTSSLQVALQALKEMDGWTEGVSEVIVPSLTFVATVNVVLHNNLIPVFVEIDPVTYCINPDDVYRAITPNTVAIMPVHLFGHPANMLSIMRLASEHHLRVIEDACEAMLASVSGKRVGSIGDVGCFSTYAAHHMVTGVGGMATTNSADLARYMRSLVNHGIVLDSLPTGETYDPSFLGRTFKFDKIGHSYRLTELEAAIGLAQLDGVEDDILQRVANAHMLTESLTNLALPLRLPSVKNGCYHTFMVYPIVLYSGVNREKVTRRLNELGVETRTMMPLINQPCYASLGIDQSKYPHTDLINSQGFYVGCHQDLSVGDLAYLVNSIDESVRSALR